MLNNASKNYIKCEVLCVSVNFLNKQLFKIFNIYQLSLIFKFKLIQINI